MKSAPCSEMTFCIREDVLKLPAIPFTPKSRAGDLDDDPLFQKIVEALDEKFTSFEDETSKWFQSLEGSVQKLINSTPRADKKKKVSLGSSGNEVGTQTEIDFREKEIQTDRTKMEEEDQNDLDLLDSDTPVKARKKSKEVETREGSLETSDNENSDSPEQEKPPPKKRRSKRKNTSSKVDYKDKDVEDDNGKEVKETKDEETTDQDWVVSDSLATSPERKRTSSKDRLRSESFVMKEDKFREMSSELVAPARSALRSSNREDQGTDLIGEMTGRRSLQSKMEEVSLKWMFAGYPWLSKALARTDGPLSSLGKNRYYRLVMNKLVILNVVFIVLQAEHASGNAEQGETTGGMYLIVDNLFTAIFALDVSLRLIGERASFFFSDDKLWNLLDFFLVLGDVLNLIVSLVLNAMGANAPSSYVASLRGAARASRAARAARTLKIFRTVSFLALPREVVAALSAVPFMIILWFFIALFFGLIFLQAASEVQLDENASAESKQHMQLYFGSVRHSLVTLFLVLLGALEWVVIYNAFEEMSPVYSSFFLLFAFFGIVAFLNAITAMCVQSCFDRVQKNEMDGKLQSSVKLAQVLVAQAKQDHFNPLAGRREFVCTWGQLVKSLDKPLVQGHLDKLGLDPSDAKGICKLMSHADSAPVNMPEFARACVKFTRTVRSADFLPVLLANKRLHLELKEFCHDVRNSRLFKRPS